MMETVMQRFPEFRFQLQTNGTLLDDLPDWVLGKLFNILVSIDGGEATTDGYRGRGIWKQMIANLDKVHAKIGGTITAHVTWGNPDTTFEEIDALASALEAIDYLYWQFVADEMYFGDTVEKRKAVLVRLIDKFFARADAFYPLIAVMGMVRNKLQPNRGTEFYAGLTQCRVPRISSTLCPTARLSPART